jgi:hypothetical protein
MKPSVSRAVAQDPRARISGAWRRAGLRAAATEGFTVVEVMVAMVVLVVGLLTMLEMVIVADHSITSNRMRQAETSVAREVLEDTRGLAYTQLTPTQIASALGGGSPPEVQGVTAVSGSTLTVSRSVYTFNVSVNACSLDDPSDGYGNHSSPPASGGSWCPDVAPSGTTDPNPDDYKRVSVTVTPVGSRTTPTIQQTILIYSKPTNGPAVSCLTTTSGSCPGSNPGTITSGSLLTFYVTTTSPADRVQWLVNGSPPPSSQVPSGAVDPYAPSGTTSSFVWQYPAADGTYTISALSYDTNGNSGTHSTLQVTLNRHVVIAPTSILAGWNDLIGGVDIQWLPSIDQDVLYYQVWHQYNGGTPALVTACGNNGNVTGTSCTVTGLTARATPPATCPAPTASPLQGTSYTGERPDLYWVVGVDTDPNTGQPRPSTQLSPKVDANGCSHQPNPPTLATPSVSNGQLTLNWSAPSPIGPDTWDTPIYQWRVYRWPANRSVSAPGDRYQLLGAVNSSSGLVTSYTDTSPDPGGVTQDYCVTTVEMLLDESHCSNVVNG